MMPRRVEPQRAKIALQIHVKNGITAYQVMEVNVKATFFLCKDVVPYIEKRSGGSIVLISSLAGYQPQPDQAGVDSCHYWEDDYTSDGVESLQSEQHAKIEETDPNVVSRESPKQEQAATNHFMGPYAISKTALLGMVKAMVPDCAEKNIRVNGLAPGVIVTRFSEPLWKNDLARENQKSLPLKRYGKPEECASIVSFLVSDDASYITGETIVTAGGRYSRL